MWQCDLAVRVLSSTIASEKLWRCLQQRSYHTIAPNRQTNKNPERKGLTYLLAKSGTAPSWRHSQGPRRARKRRICQNLVQPSISTKTKSAARKQPHEASKSTKPILCQLEKSDCNTSLGVILIQTLHKQAGRRSAFSFSGLCNKNLSSSSN